ncbi:hypothetical protein PCASD_24103 [Puccinia coronata f. sp. avenae]|uniref:Cwf19-like C-terminal domain-containing protein n=1 Tax=Puccinia coronata f. sp. avenae TaxID=200324 RepID=A0A2N5RX13_9BASI|nr:hypothetical protein PCASD_24103 [Puccinia coronata f. sp. avenae]
MYDIGAGAEEDDASSSEPGNKRKKEAKFEARDLKTGELLRFNPDDDQITLGQMVRQEKLQAGAADQRKKLRRRDGVAHHGRCEIRSINDLDYMDDNADRLARKKMKTDASKRLFAINDYARTRKALETCEFCFKDDGGPPANLGIISSGTKVYLSCTQFEELVDGHCWIVPMQHCLSSLELDDDVWDEIKNYMKCLMKMFAEKHDKGVVFYETVLSFKYQRHTNPSIPSESEWSQHKKLIDFSERPGGFRRSMVSQLPYFMIQWDFRGEKGFGHVIEGDDDHPGSSKADPGVDGTMGSPRRSPPGDRFSKESYRRTTSSRTPGRLFRREPEKYFS